MHQVLIGDAREMLKTLPDQSVQCVVTSPPYFGLRDYGTATWQGGDPECDHAPDRKPRTERQRSGLTGSLTYNDSRDLPYRDVCGKCGAVRVDNQIGLEDTVDAYVAALVDVFREVRRVLKDDGTLWLNLGDSYNSGPSEGSRPGSGRADGIVDDRAQRNRNGTHAPGLKPKDLIGIPWRVAFALQADGWYLRSEIIWHKPNPMPESVTDRPTKAHEQVFLLSKSPRYFYDAAAIAEPNTINPDWNYGSEKYRRDITQDEFKVDGDNRHRKSAGKGWSGLAPTGPDGNGRNKRSVWTVSTRPYTGAHFAVFPPKLIEPCILAGSRECDTVLDPFAGSGTTGEIAVHHGRRVILCELNPAYRPLIDQRLAQRTIWEALNAAEAAS